MPGLRCRKRAQVRVAGTIKKQPSIRPFFWENGNVPADPAPRSMLKRSILLHFSAEKAIGRNQSAGGVQSIGHKSIIVVLNKTKRAAS